MSNKQISRRRFGLHALSALAVAIPGVARADEDGPSVLRRAALQVSRPTQCVLLAVARAGGRLVAAGERGIVLLSDDSGQQWRQASVPVSVTLTALAFANEREGWATGNLGVVLHTRDGGATWTRVLDGRTAAALALTAAKALPSSGGGASEAASALIADAQRFVDDGPDKPFLDVSLRPDGSVMVVGAYGLAFSSADSGRTWIPLMSRLPNPDGFSYYGLVERRGEQFLYGEQGLLLRAQGEGTPFVTQTSPASGSLFAALTLRDGGVLMMGLRGKVYRSADVGAPWTTVQTPVDASLSAGLQLDDGSVLVVGAAGQVLASRDGGLEFSPLPVPRRFPFSGLAVAPDGSLVLVGQRGLMRLAPEQLKQALGSHSDASTSRAG